MNWNEYEKMMVTQIADAKHNLDHAKTEYKQAKVKYETLLMQQKSFNHEIEKLLGGE